MKTGRSINDIASVLAMQTAQKRDFVASSSKMNVTEKGVLQLDGVGEFGLNEIAKDQLGTFTGIPSKYFDRIVNEPLLFAFNINYWLAKQPKEKRMVRTLGNTARAFLSERYRPLDHVDLVEAILPTVVRLGCSIESAELTERKLYIKCVFPKLQGEIAKGDIVQAGLCISNSEVGCSSVRIEPLVYRLVCSNGLIANDYSLRKYHVGRGYGGEDNMIEQFMRDDTRLQNDKGFWMKVRDVVAGVLTKDVFGKIVDSMRASKEQKIEKAVTDVVEVVQKKYMLRDDEKDSVLNHLITGGDLSQYGLVNAITATAKTVDSYDRSTDLEKLGGEVLELSKVDWAALAAKK